MTTSCQRCELLRKMAADLLSERDEARAERDGAIRAMDTATECMNNRDDQNDRLREALRSLTAAVDDAMESPQEAASWAESGDMKDYINEARRALEPKP